MRIRGTKLFLCILSTALLWGVQMLTAQTNTPQSDLLKFFDDSKRFQPYNIAMGSFTFEHSGIGGSFSRYLQDLLKTVIPQSKNWFLVDTGLLNNLDPKFKEVWGSQFSVENVQAIVGGRYYDDGANVKLELEITDLSLGTLAASRTISLNKSALPSGTVIKPQNLDAALALGMQVDSSVATQSNAIDVRATVDRGPGGVYKNGEELSVLVYADQSVFLKIYQIDVNGKVQLIFPNAYFRNNKVAAKTLTRVPGPGYPFAFQLGAPYGTEFIQVLASTTQFADIEKDFTELGDAGNMKTRGLTVVQKAGDVKEVMINYSIVAK